MKRKNLSGPMPLSSNLRLTETDDMRAKRARTFPGMADWAGPGPQTCRECEYWCGGNRFANGALKPAPCQKAAALVGHDLPGVPHYAPACKYFIAAPAPPGLIKERR